MKLNIVKVKDIKMNSKKGCSSCSGEGIHSYKAVSKRQRKENQRLATQERLFGKPIMCSCVKFRYPDNTVLESDAIRYIADMHLEERSADIPVSV